MIDIHCHILSHIDDGPGSLEESVEMARIASEEGITDIVATPHVKETIHPPDVIKKKIQQLQDKIKENNFPVRIHPGGELFYLHHNSQQVIRQFSLNLSRYILIEFPLTHMPGVYENTVFSIMVNGCVPVIAHPERNYSIIKDPVLIRDLKNKGALIQLTAGSITGYFGRDVQACAEFLVENKWVHLVGSDGHSALNRPPLLKKAFKRVTRLIGEKWANRLFDENPQKILDDAPLSC